MIDLLFYPGHENKIREKPLNFIWVIFVKWAKDKWRKHLMQQQQNGCVEFLSETMSNGRVEDWIWFWCWHFKPCILVNWLQCEYKAAKMWTNVVIIQQFTISISMENFTRDTQKKTRKKTVHFVDDFFLFSHFCF